MLGDWHETFFIFTIAIEMMSLTSDPDPTSCADDQEGMPKLWPLNSFFGLSTLSMFHVVSLPRLLLVDSLRQKPLFVDADKHFGDESNEDHAELGVSELFDPMLDSL